MHFEQRFPLREFSTVARCSRDFLNRKTVESISVAEVRRQRVGSISTIPKLTMFTSGIAGADCLLSARACVRALRPRHRGAAFLARVPALPETWSRSADRSSECGRLLESLRRLMGTARSDASTCASRRGLAWSLARKSLSNGNARRVGPPRSGAVSLRFSGRR
jgi:hypothetical protein